ncbi:MAG: response regulator [Opitutae bacterium]|nr:response regulator [Opitutae bacterium]
MKVLVADDDEIERTALRDILKALPGIELIEVADGQEALDRLCDGLRPQLCLLDIRMPRLNGVQLMQSIRRDPALRDLRAVITSSNRDRNIIVSLAQLSIAGYLLKPYDSAKVIGLVRQLLGPQAEIRPVSKTILVIDDAKDIRDIFREIVTTEPEWEYVEATNGEEALKLLKKGLRPAFCFCDLMMPKLDGIGLLQQMREFPDFASVPIVVISAENKVQSVQELAGLRILGYLIKPFDLTTVRGFLRQRAKELAAPPA